MKKSTGVITILLLLHLFGCALRGGNAVKESAPPLIISSVPANGAVKVSVNAKISITVPVSLDEATVDPGTVTVRKFNSRAMAFPGYSVTYRPLSEARVKFSPAIRTKLAYRETDRTIMLAPVEPLEYGAKYLVLIEGVKDTAGNVLTRTAVTFETYKNPEKRIVRYREGAVDSYTDLVYDANGNLLRRISFDRSRVYKNCDPAGRAYAADCTSAGPDGKWFTRDDVVFYYHAYTYDARGNQTSGVTYFNPGADGKWFTADDTVSDYSSYVYDENGNLVRYVPHHKPGPDGKWFTEDDEVIEYSDYLYDANGDLIRFVRYAKGPDRKLLTPDDEVSYYYDVVYDANGDMLREAQYVTAGRDGEWFTGDDVLHHYVAYTYNAGGNPTGTVRYDGPGPDGQWFTGDDVPVAKESYCPDSETYDARRNMWRHVKYMQLERRDEAAATDCLAYSYDEVRDLNGTASRRVTYSGTGPDGKWFTTDDEAGAGYSFYINDANGNLVRNVSYHKPGPDGKWFTEDDISEDFKETTYDPHGNRIQSISYSNAGPDGKLFTQDDVRKTCEEYATEF